MGVLTPQANPTAESEFHVLLPPGMAMLSARLTSRAASPRERLVEYIERLGDCLDTFDTLRPDVVAMACTGSAYLVGCEREQALIAAQQDRLGYPILSATQAIHESLQTMGARRLAVFAPYPEWLLDAGREYWASLGYEIVAHGRIVTRSADTRTIYELGSEDARAVLRELKPADVDVVLLSGTGMPSLPLVIAHEDFTDRPVVSSNWCLADRALGVLGLSLDAKAVGERLAAARGR